MGKFVDKMVEDAVANDPKIFRKRYQSFFTAAEWQNVQISVDFAEHINAGKPIQTFPYLEELLTYWKVLINSYNTARQYDSARDILLSEYFVMNLFITVMTSIECLIKGLMMLPFRLLTAGIGLLTGEIRNNTPLQKIFGETFSDYEKFIHHTPFFNYPYMEKLSPMFSKIPRSFSDLLLLLSTVPEYLLRGLLGKIVGSHYNKEENTAPKSISVMVKFSKDGLHDRDELAEEFKKKLEGLAEEIDEDGRKDIVIVEDSIRTKVINRQSEPLQADKQRSYAYAHIMVPRYKLFEQTTLKLVKNGVKVRKVAGQDDMLMQLILESKDKQALKAEFQSINQRSGMRVSFAYDNYSKRAKTSAGTFQKTVGVAVSMRDFNAAVGYATEMPEGLSMDRSSSSPVPRAGVKLKLKLMHD